MAEITVTLPDGKPLELPEGATRRRRRGGDRAGPGQGGAGDPRRRRAARPLGAARRRGGDRDPHRPRPRGAGADPPRRRPRDGRGGARALPGDQGDDRPADRGRLLLRLRVPRRRQGSPRTTWSGSRRRCAPTSRPTSPSSAATSRSPRRSSCSAEQGQDYKVELIEDLVRDEGVETVSLYRNGPFEDLCRGPHGPSTGRIKAIKLNSVAGAYWRGDESRQMLTRIYGTAFFSKKDLEAHLERIEQAKARDHRRLGPQLGLFMLREEAPGMPFWLPNGTSLLRPDRGRGARAAAQARLPGDRHPAGPRRGALAPLRATGTTTATTCTSWSPTSAASRCGR